MAGTENGVLYDRSLTFGRFNIPHYGHVHLVKEMLLRSQSCNICVSSGYRNNSWDLRVLLFRVLLRQEGVDLGRVCFSKFKSPLSFLHNCLNKGSEEKVLLVWGEDQVLLAEEMSEAFGLDFHLNERICSSTSLRESYIQEGFSSFREYYKRDYCARLATQLVQEELNGVKTCNHTKETTQDPSETPWPQDSYNFALG